MCRLRFFLLTVGCMMLSAPAVPISSFALDSVFGDHMVLQRNRPIRISGSAQAGMVVTVSLDGERARSVANEDGRWTVELSARAEGGPYEVCAHLASDGFGGTLSTIRLEDVMIGEVWLGSGQSNMEFWVLGENLEQPPFYHLPDGEAFAAEKDPDLRILYVPRGMSVDGECRSLPGGTAWKRADTVAARGRCSAVALWFATYLRRNLGNVPVGIVSASWGGTPIETWIPESAYRKVADAANVQRLELCRPPAYSFSRNRLLDGKALRDARRREMNVWLEKFLATDPAATRRALAEWAKPGIDLAGWKKGPRVDMNGLAVPGVVWYRFEFDVPETWQGEASVHIDSVNDCDETFLDGEKIGTTGIETERYWSVPRNYPVRNLVPGRHVVALRVQDHYMSGWIRDRLWVEERATGRRILLGEGDWCERIEFRADLERIGQRPVDVDGSVPEPRYSSSTPTALYNAMIAPLTPMTIGGAIWYQGCANADQVVEYPRLQKLLIDAWREKFHNPTMPFVLTQLSAFQTHVPNSRLQEDFWKEQSSPSQCIGFGAFRIMQDTFRAYPGIGVACTIDIGDSSDIHPTNKREVGRRLAHEAMRLAFGRAEFPQGPRAASVERRGAAVVVWFDNVGTGLTLGDGVRDFHPHLFALAGVDGKFRWADGRLETDGSVVVSASEVADPVRVQYCVSAYPPGVCFRRAGDGIPVYPFDLNLNHMEDGMQKEMR